MLVNHRSPVDAKIALFRSLFRGRDDVYARRFENFRTGKSGYAPACGNEWVTGVCEKPRIKCAACLHQRFLPITDEVIRAHLSGRDATSRPFVMGVYPLLRDETCYFLAIDLDKQDWRNDSLALVDTCRRLKLPAAIERSRSGQGAHLWLFFDETIPACTARKLGAHLITETMDRRPDLGLDSYDRFFPNQDTLPVGGFGNLIALPLQKAARACGNSVFVDDAFQPIPDQWELLSSLRRISRGEAEQVVARAEKRGHVVGVRFHSFDENDPEPWKTPPSRGRIEPLVDGDLPSAIEVVLADQIYIRKENTTPTMRNRLLRLAAFQNPEFYKAQAMRLPTFGKPRVVACAEDSSDHLALPRGCLTELRQLLGDWGVKIITRDERHLGRRLDVRFLGELRVEQLTAARAMLRHDTGVLAATTAFGKTVIGAWLIGERKVNTLILVHRRQLLEQWVQRLATFLDLAPKQIGRIGGGRRRATGVVDVAVIQSLWRKGVVDDIVGDYGQIIVDECHHLSAVSFEQVVRRAKAKYVVGLSATVARKDGHHPIVLMQCGPVRYRVDAKAQAAARPFEHSVLVRPTGFRPLAAAAEDKRVQFQSLYAELVADRDRNRMICEDVRQALCEGRSPLILTERNEHLDGMAECFSPDVADLIVLRGGMKKKQLRESMERIAVTPREKPRVVLATGRYVGEGFDDARLDTLFLTLPVSWRGTVAQYAGRLHRLHEGKREVRIYDYADLASPMLARMFDRRCRSYESIGYRILLPASAVPGWPIEVPLPVDPLWKRDYAASVNRLIRDGVDAPLARLFASAARPVSQDAQGVARARSATEAFLYRRLQTLEQTAGRFQLNAPLPLPFDGDGKMEVDLFCADARIAVELDGAQHLDGAEAYRRDRRKDWLLQQNRYMVLRFLAEDVGKDLSGVLDRILIAIGFRSSS